MEIRNISANRFVNRLVECSGYSFALSLRMVAVCDCGNS